MRTRNPIRVFYSTLSQRFYATRAWKEIRPGLVECTGERFDVTDDIAGIIEREKIVFMVEERHAASQRQEPQGH